MSPKPHVLVTGFGSFPGAPVNPTAALVTDLQSHSGAWSAFARVETRVFDVDYRRLPVELDTIAAVACPDIAIHFGLAASARGFRLERMARNEVRPGSPDNTGYLPEQLTICDAGETLDSSLPLETIAAALETAGLPVEFSDDAGGYLCNFLFYHARSGLCPAYRPALAGFIHVPPLPGPFSPFGLPPETLLEGAIIVLRTCVEAWQAGSGDEKSPARGRAFSVRIA